MAVTITAEQLAAAATRGANPVDMEIINRLLPVATELVNRYSGPATPDSISNEAVVRTVSYLISAPPDTIQSRTVGPLATTYTPSMISALRHSGSMALLSPWKVRRAGIVK